MPCSVNVANCNNNANLKILHLSRDESIISITIIYTVSAIFWRIVPATGKECHGGFPANDFHHCSLAASYIST